MTIASGYILPFRFTRSDLKGMGEVPLFIRVRTALPDDAELVTGAVRLFAQLAMTGAFGSDHLAPWETAFSVAGRSSSDRQDFVFRIERCRLADEAWIVLCHLLLGVHRHVPIRGVDVLMAEDVAPVTLSALGQDDTTYPLTYARLPFLLNDLEPEGGGFSLFITLESPLKRENEEMLNGWLEVWVQAVLNGGYALVPADPASGYVEPYGEGVDAYEATVEWAVFKLQADPVAAIAAVLNQLACFHVRGQPIRTVEIG